MCRALVRPYLEYYSFSPFIQEVYTLLKGSAAHSQNDWLAVREEIDDTRAISISV